MKKTMLTKLLAAIALAASPLVITGCIHRSGGTWMVRSAPTPYGWPELTPIGEVAIREYPAYRAAEVAEVDLDRSGMQPLFMALFDHIKTNEIAMTAPVDMGYADADGAQPRMERMAFVYRSREIGQTGGNGPVVVEDLPPTTYASVGVRGRYTTANFKRGLTLLEGYLAAHEEWRAIGEPRYLGYNGPLTLWFLRYGEVQVPVERAE
jgi:hypothetical protein